MVVGIGLPIDYQSNSVHPRWACESLSIEYVHYKENGPQMDENMPPLICSPCSIDDMVLMKWMQGMY